MLVATIDPTLLSALAALGGALIGGLFTMWAAVRTLNKQSEAERLRNQGVIQAVLQALHDEVESLWEQYDRDVGSLLAAHEIGKPFLIFYPITQGYFTVYDANAIYIGQIPDSDLRKAIVSTYSVGRGLIDTFAHNNSLIERHQELVMLADQTNNPIFGFQANDVLNALGQYSTSLKNNHLELRTKVDDLLRRLRKKGVLAEPSSLRSSN